MFDQARLQYITIDITDISRSPPPTEFKMTGTETGSENKYDRNELTTRFQHSTQHLRPCWTRPYTNDFADDDVASCELCLMRRNPAKVCANPSLEKRRLSARKGIRNWTLEGQVYRVIYRAYE